MLASAGVKFCYEVLGFCWVERTHHYCFDTATIVCHYEEWNDEVISNVNIHRHREHSDAILNAIFEIATKTCGFLAKTCGLRVTPTHRIHLPPQLTRTLFYPHKAYQPQLPKTTQSHCHFKKLLTKTLIFLRQAI